MKIVVTDGYTLNPGDLDWSPLAELGELVVYDRTPAERVVDRCSDAQVVLTNKVVLDRSVIASLPDLQFIGVLATGYNVVDIDAASARGIVVSNVPAYSTMSVAQQVFALLLALVNRVSEHDQQVQAGRWSGCEDFCFTVGPLTELADLTLGIVGFGAIGRAVAGIGQAFGMQVLVHTRTAYPQASVAFVDLPTLLARSDVVTLHCPLTEQTEQLINAERLCQMRPGAYLINTGRGALLDEPAVAAALRSGRLAGAGLDVLTEEPPAADHPLLGVRGCLITPHIGWSTTAARRRLMDTAVANVRSFLAGSAQNVVNAK